MYESGGQLTIFGWLVTVIVGGALAVGIVAQLLKSSDATEVIGGIGSIFLWGFVVYKIVRRRRK